MSQESYSRDGVVLLHGLARTSKSMSKLERVLREDGYQVLNIGYPSRSDTIENLAAEIRERIVEETAAWDRVHFVTHSMGGILVRDIQKSDPLDSIGRVVMLAPPNGGSEVVDKLGANYFFRKLNGPAGGMLGTDPEGFVAGLGEIDFELGVIAGDRSVNPMLSLLIPGPNDGKVSVERTKVEGMAAFLVVHASHPFLMRNKSVIECTLRFLETGAFE